MLISDTTSAIGATIARIVNVGDLTNLEDVISNTDLAMWSHVEVGIAIIASSVATLRPLFTQLKSWARYECSQESAWLFCCQT